MSWWEYVERVAQTSRQRDISDKTSLDPSAVSRWKTGHVPKADMVATFARAYGRPVLEAFVAAGFLTAAEAKERPSAAPSLDQLSDEDLLQEVADRMATLREKEHRHEQAQEAPKKRARGSRAKPQGATDLAPGESIDAEPARSRRKDRGSG